MRAKAKTPKLRTQQHIRKKSKRLTKAPKGNKTHSGGQRVKQQVKQSKTNSMHKKRAKRNI